MSCRAPKFLGIKILTIIHLAFRRGQCTFSLATIKRKIKKPFINLLKNYHKIGVNMTSKIYFYSFVHILFPKNLGNVSDEHCEGFQDKNMLANYSCTTFEEIQRNRYKSKRKLIVDVLIFISLQNSTQYFKFYRYILVSFLAKKPCKLV